jgi:hypothetical protein
MPHLKLLKNVNVSLKTNKKTKNSPNFFFQGDKNVLINSKKKMKNEKPIFNYLVFLFFFHNFLLF